MESCGETELHKYASGEARGSEQAYHGLGKRFMRLDSGRRLNETMEVKLVEAVLATTTSQPTKNDEEQMLEW